MKRMSMWWTWCVSLSAVLLMGSVANAASGSKKIVNLTDGTVFVVAVQRSNTSTADDGNFFMEVPKGSSKTLHYTSTFLNQFIVSQTSFCAVTVNALHDAGDDLLNDNNTLTIAEEGTEPAHDNEKKGAETCVVTGSNT